jgi:hypothetical protein
MLIYNDLVKREMREELELEQLGGLRVGETATPVIVHTSSVRPKTGHEILRSLQLRPTPPCPRARRR